jgi:ABC-type transport system involved in cytochrome bd biosynthesis fused ATPase/permease subunit
MDVETAEVMEKVINDVFGECTVIAITHRPNDVENAHVILDVQNGKITARDGQRA